MGLFRGAVVHNGGVPENCPLALVGRFSSSIGRLPTLMGCSAECLTGPFSLLKIPWKTAHQERGIKRILTRGCDGGAQLYHWDSRITFIN